MHVNSLKIIIGKVIKKEDDKALVRCFMGFDNIQDKYFDISLLKNIESEFLLIGIRTNNSKYTVNIIDGDDYKEEILNILNYG